MLPFIFCIPQINAGQFGMDLGIVSSYDATTTRNWGGLDLGAGEAKLTGSDLRFLYYIDENLSYGLRLASHEGEDTTDLYSGYAYKISISETSPLVKYSFPFSGSFSQEMMRLVLGGYLLKFPIHIL